MEAHPTLEEQIKTAQEGHPGVQRFKHLMAKGKAPQDDRRSARNPMVWETSLCSPLEETQRFDTEGSSQLSIYPAPRQHQDVSRYEDFVLVVTNKKIHHRVCSLL